MKPLWGNLSRFGYVRGPVCDHGLGLAKLSVAVLDLDMVRDGMLRAAATLPCSISGPYGVAATLLVVLQVPQVLQMVLFLEDLNF
ncbi:hypothetical protein LIER_23910 [Lithospermum erythrorhizon]|uniref:Uncharacterized protein n=1 Tax=Lithospermum erythrorhizon TaxID=34254 RepID=A0AAV3QZ80_LITER